MVTITGTDLLVGSSSIVRVTLAGVDVEEIVFQNDTVVIVEAGLTNNPDASVGDVVLYTVDESTVTETNGFSYIQLSDIHSITPASGQYGTVVTLSGIELLAGSSGLSSVTLAGITAEIVSASATDVVVVAAASSIAVTGDVVLTTSSGASILLNNGWDYVPQANVTAISRSCCARSTGALNR